MRNFYTLEVYKKQNRPCFVVTISHIMLAGVYFFDSMIEAKKFIATKKEELKYASFSYNPLSYNAEGCTDIATLNTIEMVLNNENIKIGENGKTYMEA